MKTIEDSIIVNVPVSQAYNQWTQFEEFPKFMKGVTEVKQLDDRRLYWKAVIAGKSEEWEAEIFEQTPDQQIAWRSTSGAKNEGRVSFTPAGPNQTKVQLLLGYEPVGVVENLGDALGVLSLRVWNDLNRFKEFIETQPAATGEWRGEIHEPAGHAN